MLVHVTHCSSEGTHLFRISTSLNSSDPKLDTCLLSSASRMAFLEGSFRSLPGFLSSLANDSEAYLEQASKKSFLTNSFTRTKSGA